jgi:hypothetical protein
MVAYRPIVFDNDLIAGIGSQAISDGYGVSCLSPVETHSDMSPVTERLCAGLSTSTQTVEIVSA